MATTCKLIAKNVLGSATSSITFSSIPNTYTDLLLCLSVRTTGSNILTGFRFNGTSSGYTFRIIRGRGDGVDSLTQATWGAPVGGGAAILIGYSNNAANIFTNMEVYVPNYAGSENKTASCMSVQESNVTSAFMFAGAGLWSNTAAVTSLTVLPESGNLEANSSFYLYGITKA